MPAPSVSVIVPVYNGAATIGETLRAIGQQQYDGALEVVVADDGSTDETPDVVRAFPVSYFRQENAGPASARNAAARRASGTILIFTDADCRPEPHWVARLVQGFTTDAIGVVAGSYAIANPQDPVARVIHDEIRFRHERLMSDFPKAFGSYNFAIRRELFERVGGFNTSYRRASGEDNDLSYKVLKAGKKIFFDRQALVAHYHQSSVVAYWKEQYRHGFWRVRMYADHTRMAAGDGYTFWKDIIEPPWVLALVILLCFGHAGLAAAGAGGLLFFEMSAAILMVREVRDVVLGGFIFWVRAFARTLGFFLGGVIFLLEFLKKGKKI